MKRVSFFSWAIMLAMCVVFSSSKDEDDSSSSAVKEEFVYLGGVYDRTPTVYWKAPDKSGLTAVKVWTSKYGGSAITEASNHYMEKSVSGEALTLTYNVSGKSGRFNCALFETDYAIEYEFSIQPVFDKDKGDIKTVKFTRQRTVPLTQPNHSRSFYMDHWDVNWTYPEDNGGSPITKTKVKVDNGEWREFNAPITTFSIPGNVNNAPSNITYIFVNEFGESEETTFRF